ncbi:MAG: hypothetical protein EBX40_00505 [Gammaproteobacteria bacterium]|nr:hypothetical protein [Gammaproteobacteria bacterium]
MYSLYRVSPTHICVNGDYYPVNEVSLHTVELFDESLNVSVVYRGNILIQNVSAVEIYKDGSQTNVYFDLDELYKAFVQHYVSDFISPRYYEPDTTFYSNTLYNPGYTGAIFTLRNTYPGSACEVVLQYFDNTAWYDVQSLGLVNTDSVAVRYTFIGLAGTFRLKYIAADNEAGQISVDINYIS